jgi:hypothetical protein
MADQEQPKRRRGRPPKYAGQGKRWNFSFRISEKTHLRLIEAVKQSGNSLSEEIEARLNRDLNWQATRADIDRMRAEIAAALSTARVQAIRAAGLQILREIDGKPTRAIVDLETLLAEADGVARGMRSGFVDPDLPAVEAPRRMTPEQEQRLLDELQAIKRQLDAAVDRTLAADAAASSTDDEAA